MFAATNSSAPSNSSVTVSKVCDQVVSSPSCAITRSNATAFSVRSPCCGGTSQIRYNSMMPPAISASDTAIRNIVH